MLGVHWFLADILCGYRSALLYRYVLVLDLIMRLYQLGDIQTAKNVAYTCKSMSERVFLADS
jgi:hypothetical protein